LNYQEQIIKAAKEELARRKLIHFTEYLMPNFDTTPFHNTYYEILELFARKEIKRLIISCPPQHGKSTGSTIMLPSYILGLFPDTKIGIGSYNATFAKKFNRDVQRVISDENYQSVFPETKLNQKNVVTVATNYLRNSETFEIVNRLGSLKAVGRGGGITGNPIDVMIMDDLYKDSAEGNSPLIRENVWEWYIGAVKTRLHNYSQELIVFTRWHQDDLIGRLEKHDKVVEIKSIEEIADLDPKTWIKINFEAIKTGEPTPLDPREQGEPLYPKRHSLDNLNDKKALDPEAFSCLYQGNPKSQKGLLYSHFETYTELPEIVKVKNYTDVADGGGDYLCSVTYGVGNDGKFYIVDMVYSDESAENTEPQVAEMLNRNKVSEAYIESNSGGKAYARNIEKLVSRSCVVTQFHQSQNKESRILTNSANVNRSIIFPFGWHNRFPIFFEHLTGFKKLYSANRYKDCADVLTGIVEKEENANTYQIIW
jgi:predicted phage terminase large subunit-like protein